MKAIELLQKWQSLYTENRATIKAEPYTTKNSRITDRGEQNSKFIANLMRLTAECLNKPDQLSLYNPAHTIYGNCCGIFNSINKDEILCCNECGMTINKLIEEICEK